MAFAGMDVGTSGCKLLIYDLDGNVIFSLPENMQRKEPATQRAESGGILSAVKELLKEAGKECPASIEAMAVTSLGESVVCLDENDRVLANSMLTETAADRGNRGDC